MNRKQFQILVAVGLVLGGCGLFVLRSQRDSYKISDATSTQKVLPTFPLNEIERVRIKQSSGEVNLEKSDELWRVKERSGYLANFSEISDLLRKVWENPSWDASSCSLQTREPIQQHWSSSKINPARFSKHYSSEKTTLATREMLLLWVVGVLSVAMS